MIVTPPSNESALAAYLADISLTHGCGATISDIKTSDVTLQQDGTYQGICSNCNKPFVIPAPSTD